MRRISLFCLAVMLAPTWGHAGTLHIESERMLLDHQASRVEFTGNVLLTQDDFRLQCDKLIAHYSSNGRKQLEKAEAYGHVRMRQGDAHGGADKALLDQRQGILILTGNAFVEQHGGRIEGQTITHSLHQQQTTVSPGEHGRTRLILDTADQATPAEAGAHE